MSKEKEANKTFEKELKLLNHDFAEKLKGLKKGPERQTIENRLKYLQMSLKEKYGKGVDKKQSSSKTNKNNKKDGKEEEEEEEEEEETNIVEEVVKPYRFLASLEVVSQSLIQYFEEKFTFEQEGKPYQQIGGIKRGPNYIPNCPIFHTYHHPWVLAPYVCCLPNEIYVNLPISIKQAMEKYVGIDYLVDYYFVPQPKSVFIDEDVVEVEEEYDESKKDELICLKSWPWIFPARPKLDDIKGKGAEYTKTIFMGVFEPTAELKEGTGPGKMKDKWIKINSINPYRVNLHNGRVSPNNANLNLTVIKGKSVALFSLCILKNEKRAAVTLHWLLTIQDFVKLRTLSEKKENVKFGQFLDTLRDMYDPLLLESLNQLVKTGS